MSVLLTWLQRLDIPTLRIQMHWLIHTLSHFNLFELRCVCCQFLVHTFTHWLSQSVHLWVKVLVRLSLFNSQRMHSFSLILEPIFYLIYFHFIMNWFPIKACLRLIHILLLFLIAEQIGDWMFCSYFKSKLCILMETSLKTWL